jgi:Chalcone isomerase-like
MAHYIEGMNPVKNEDEAYSAILSEGRAKQIIMTFVRNVDAKTICNTYNEGFKNNASEAEYKELKPLIDKFLGYFTKDVKENDQFLYKWTPDGNVIAVINNEEKPAISGKLFARTLWSIWFGKDSVVDREDLVARMIGKN